MHEHLAVSSLNEFRNFKVVVDTHIDVFMRVSDMIGVCVCNPQLDNN